MQYEGVILNYAYNDMGNLYTNLGGYFKIPFIMAEVDNLYAKLRGYLAEVDIFLRNYNRSIIIGDDDQRWRPQFEWLDWAASGPKNAA